MRCFVMLRADGMDTFAEMLCFLPGYLFVYARSVSRNEKDMPFSLRYTYMVSLYVASRLDGYFDG